MSVFTIFVSVLVLSASYQGFIPVTNTVPSLLNLVPLSERILKTEAKIYAL